MNPAQPIQKCYSSQNILQYIYELCSAVDKVSLALWLYNATLRWQWLDHYSAILRIMR